MTLSDLTRNFPQLEWATFLKKLVPTVSSATIEVFVFDYFTNAFQELYKLGYKKVFNALLAIYAQNVYSNVVFESVTSDREGFCAERTFDTFPDPVNYINKINERNLDVEKNITEIIFNKLKKQLSVSLNTASNWMESDVIAKFQNKLNNIVLRFNENSDFSSAEFENRYQNFTLETDAYVSNLEKAMIKRRQNLYSLWGENVNKRQM